MSKKLRNPVNILIARGVKMPQPETVFIGGDMMPERIARVLRSIRGAALRAIKLPWGRDVRWARKCRLRLPIVNGVNASSFSLVLWFEKN